MPQSSGKSEETLLSDSIDESFESANEEDLNEAFEAFEAFEDSGTTGVEMAMFMNDEQLKKAEEYTTEVVAYAERLKNSKIMFHEYMSGYSTGSDIMQGELAKISLREARKGKVKDTNGSMVDVESEPMAQPATVLLRDQAEKKYEEVRKGVEKMLKNSNKGQENLQKAFSKINGVGTDEMKHLREAMNEIVLSAGDYNEANLAKMERFMGIVSKTQLDAVTHILLDMKTENESLTKRVKSLEEKQKGGLDEKAKNWCRSDMNDLIKQSKRLLVYECPRPSADVSLEDWFKGLKDEKRQREVKRKNEQGEEITEIENFTATVKDQELEFGRKVLYQTLGEAAKKCGFLDYLKDVFITTDKRKSKEKEFKPTLILDFLEETAAKALFEISERMRRTGQFGPNSERGRQGFKPIALGKTKAEVEDNKKYYAKLDESNAKNHDIFMRDTKMVKESQTPAEFADKILKYSISEKKELFGSILNNIRMKSGKRGVDATYVTWTRDYSSHFRAHTKNDFSQDTQGRADAERAADSGWEKEFENAVKRWKKYLLHNTRKCKFDPTNTRIKNKLKNNATNHWFEAAKLIPPTDMERLKEIFLGSQEMS